MRYFIAILTLLFFLPAPARAAEDPFLIGSFDSWNAYYFTDNGNKVCFMSAAPREQRGLGGRKRGEVLLFITHWPADGTKNVVSISAGYPYAQNSLVKAAIGGKTFDMFTEGEMAWTRDQGTDNALTAAIRQGNTLEVTGTSGRGTTTTDVYSLKGSSAAYDAISKACNA